MWNILRSISLLLLFANISLAQNPSGVSFVINTKNGQTTFRKGEPIPVELRFQATAPGRYQVITDPSHRAHLNSPRVYDQFTGEPAADAVDPLREQTRILEFMTGAPPKLAPLTETPVIFEEVVNEWISFRNAGRYQITAQTSRLSLVDTSQNSEPVFFPKQIPLKSNTIEIEIVPAEEEWTNAQLTKAVASLTPVPEPNDFHREKETDAAARVLRFLETRDAALAMVRFFDRGPSRLQLEISAGLYGSPYRKEILSALEDGLRSPEVPVAHKWIDTLTELATAHEFGPAPPYNKDSAGYEAWNQHFMANRERYMKIVSDAVAGKQGQARAVTLDLLTYQNRPKPASPESIAAFVKSFRDLPEDTQNRYLTSDWHRIASPEMEPLILSLAKGTGQTRDAALARLQELDPAAARPIILDRIRKGDIPKGPYSDPRTLLALPDQVLPEMDRPLVDLLEQDKDVGALISRYASDAIFGRIQAWVEAHPHSACGGTLLPYLFRVDPVYAADRLARTRKFEPYCSLSVFPTEGLFINPGLEKTAIADLDSQDVSIQRSALTVLQNGGSAAAEEPLLNGMERLRKSDRNLQDQRSLETGYMEALTRGVGWILSPEKLDRVLAACVSDFCTRNVESMRRYVEPIGINCEGLGSDQTVITIGQYSVHGIRQMEAKIRQFPRGTKFYFPNSYKGIWHYEQRMSEFRRILDAAGMRVVDQPTGN